MHRIIPTILESDFSEIEKKLKIYQDFTDTVHIDFIDGLFFDTKTFLDPTPFIKYSDKFFLEAHFMVDNPTQYLKPFATAGFKRFLGHIEKMPDQAEFVAEGRILGEVGLAIDGPTSVDEIKANFDDLDVLLIMTIKAGASGQEFIPEYLEKKSFVLIEVDGGINTETILAARDAGASRFCTNKFIFDGDPKSQFEKLIRALE
ncbi:MAG: hypothetical protein HYT09_02640 [Candidatus Levybacteria bacterium]|nr:hypothetical protein [Candidatus Levybacteria bacterium]